MVVIWNIVLNYCTVFWCQTFILFEILTHVICHVTFLFYLKAYVGKLKTVMKVSSKDDSQDCWRRMRMAGLRGVQKSSIWRWWCMENLYHRILLMVLPCIMLRIPGLLLKTIWCTLGIWLSLYYCVSQQLSFLFSSSGVLYDETLYESAVGLSTTTATINGTLIPTTAS